MSLHWKQQRLIEATERFNSFHRLVDVIAIALFTVSAIAASNKLLPKKLVNVELLDLSWQSIGTCFVFFLALVVIQLNQYRRELSAFEREATIKAARSRLPPALRR